MTSNAKLFNNAPFSDLLTPGGESSPDFVINNGRAPSSPLPSRETWLGAAAVIIESDGSKYRTSYVPTPGFEQLEEPIADAWTDFHAGILKEVQNPDADPFETHLTNQCFWIVAASLFKNRVLKTLPHITDVAKSDSQVVPGGALAYMTAHGKPRVDIFHHREFEVLKQLKSNGRAVDYLSLTPVEEKIYSIMPNTLPGSHESVNEFGAQVPRTSIGLRLFTRLQMLEDLGRLPVKVPAQSSKKDTVVAPPSLPPTLSVVRGGLHADAA